MSSCSRARGEGRQWQPVLEGSCCGDTAEMGVKRAAMRWRGDDKSGDRSSSPRGSRLSLACRREASQRVRKVNHIIWRDKLLKGDSQRSSAPAWDSVTPLNCVSLLSAACRCPFWEEGEINIKEQMQLTANARKSMDGACPEQVSVLAKWSRQVGVTELPAQPPSVGLTGKVLRGAEGLGPGVGPPDPTGVVHQTYQREPHSSPRPAPSPGASRAEGAC